MNTHTSRGSHARGNEVVPSRWQATWQPRSVREAFLDQFDQDVQPWILEFASLISGLTHDVLIFTARKSACLYDAMRRVGLVTGQGTVVSDRVLDMDLSWLTDKSIALIDDVLITGSSLYRAREVLKAAGAKSVDTYALAVDSKYWVPDLVQPSGPVLHLPSQAAINLCTQIVNALAVVPRPYNLDWPLIENLGTPRASISVLSTLPNWSSFPTTNSIQRGAGILSLTHEPDSGLLARFSHITGLPQEVLSLTKVRTYSRNAVYDQKRVLSTVVPIVAFDGLSVGEVDTVFQTICQEFASHEVTEFSSPESRLRAIQFIIAMRLGRFWLDDLEASTHIIAGESLQHNQIALAFPPTAAELIRVSASAPVALPRFTVRPRLLETVQPQPYLRHDSDPPPDGYVSPEVAGADRIMDLLTEPFMSFYEARELPARLVLQRHGRDAFNDPEYIETIDRLNSGLPLEDLFRVAADAMGADGGDASRAVSAFLDMAIDHGVAVPITQFKNGMVQRAYRHGEDIVYSKNESRLFSLMLKAAMDARAVDVGPGEPTAKAPSMSRLEVEKLCVLFTRIGLNLRFFTRWHGRLGAAGTLGTRWHLKGALMQVNSPVIFGANLGDGLSDELQRLEVIRRSRTGTGYSFGAVVAHTSSSPQADALAEGIGHMLGQLTSGTAGSARLSSNDLTLLASCFDLPSVVGALTAEVSIVARDWPAFQHRLASQELNHERCADLLQSLIRQDLWESMMSGEFKYSRYEAGAITEILDRVATALSGDPLRRPLWRSYWSDSVGADTEISPALAAHKDALGRWVTSVAGLLWVLRFGLEAASTTSSSAKARRSLTRAQEMSERHRSYVKGRQELALAGLVQIASDQASSGHVDHGDLIRLASLAIEKHVAWATSLIDKTKAVANPFGEARSYVSFDFALIVYSRATEDRVPLNAMMSGIVSQRRKSAEGRAVRLDPVRLTNDADEPFTVVARGARAYSYLNGIAERIAAQADARLGLRIVLVPDLVDHEQVHTSATQAGGHYGTGFEKLREELGAHPRMSHGLGSQIIHAYRSGPQRVEDYVHSAISHTFAEHGRAVVADSIDSGMCNGRTIRVIAVGGSQSEMRTQADVGIVTIIRPEAAAVREWLARHGGGTRERHGTSIFHVAQVDVDGVPLRIAHIQASSQGDAAALSAFHNLTSAVQPRVVVLLGIAGGIHRDARLGDVVIGSQIINYGPYAATENGPRHRGHGWTIPVGMVNAIHDYLSSDAGDKLDASPASASLGRPHFKLVEGPIGTGPAVVKFRDAEVRIWLDQFNEKTLALETEAEAACRFFYEKGESGEVSSYLIVRAISDHADIDKNDDWHQAAAANAVLALEALLPSIAFAYPVSERALQDDPSTA